jgi:glucose-1-phosphate adenylyltransferase
MSILSDLNHLKTLAKQSQKASKPRHPSIDQVITLILGGGQGKRLFPLTSTRCKPAICFGGHFRLIDIPMSNAINSGCQKIFIITQFLSTSLHQHICKTYRLGTYSSGFVELLAAEQKPSKETWFQGTADAVRQNMDYLVEIPGDYFLILSGDQLYNMDFQKMLDFASETDADLVIATLPINKTDAKRMGVMRINSQQFVTEFHEKPQQDELLSKLELSSRFFQESGLNPSADKHYLGSMGIYLFKRETLFNLLKLEIGEDFGKHLIPHIVSQGKVAAYMHEGYWEDIGTIESFYKANIALTENAPAFDCYDQTHPIYTVHSHLPAPKIMDTLLKNAIICEGSIIEAAEISHSILGPRSIVKKGTVIRHSYLMGNDYYHSPVHFEDAPIQIGENCLIENALIDKQVSIGNNVKLTNRNNVKEFSSDDLYIRDGIIIVPRGTHLPDNFNL